MTDIYFRNNTPSTVYVAIMRYAPDICNARGDWLVEGWWTINPGQTVFPFRTSNRYFAYYAEGGGLIWNGSYGAYVDQTAFAHCSNTTTGRFVGMRLGDCDNFSTYTINLNL